VVLPALNRTLGGLADIRFIARRSRDIHFPEVGVLRHKFWVEVALYLWSEKS
jgi:hypothetical protein